MSIQVVYKSGRTRTIDINDKPRFLLDFGADLMHVAGLAIARDYAFQRNVLAVIVREA